MDTIKGKTRYGFEFEIPRYKIDDMELMERIAYLDDDNAMEIVRFIKDFLGDDLKKELYDSVRTEDGNVPVEATMNSLMDILASAGAGAAEEEDGKNA